MPGLSPPGRKRPSRISRAWPMYLSSSPNVRPTGHLAITAATHNDAPTTNHVQACAARTAPSPPLAPAGPLMLLPEQTSARRGHDLRRGFSRTDHFALSHDDGDLRQDEATADEVQRLPDVVEGQTTDHREDRVGQRRRRCPSPACVLEEPVRAVERHG